MQIGKPRAKQIKMNDGRNTILVQKSLKYGVLLLTPRAHSYTRENISESSSSGGNNNIQTHWLLVCLLTHSPTVNLNINWWCCWVSLSLSVGWLVRLFGFIRFVRNCLSTTTIASHRETQRERERTSLFTFAHKTRRTNAVLSFGARTRDDSRAHAHIICVFSDILVGLGAFDNHFFVYNISIVFELLSSLHPFQLSSKYVCFFFFSQSYWCQYCILQFAHTWTTFTYLAVSALAQVMVFELQSRGNIALYIEFRCCCCCCVRLFFTLRLENGV